MRVRGRCNAHKEQHKIENWHETTNRTILQNNSTCKREEQIESTGRFVIVMKLCLQVPRYLQCLKSLVAFCHQTLQNFKGLPRAAPEPENFNTNVISLSEPCMSGAQSVSKIPRALVCAFPGALCCCVIFNDLGALLRRASTVFSQHGFPSFLMVGKLFFCAKRLKIF